METFSLAETLGLLAACYIPQQANTAIGIQVTLLVWIIEVIIGYTSNRTCIVNPKHFYPFIV